MQLMYEPHLPLGARLIEADEEGHRIKEEIRHFPEEDQAHLEMEVPTGSSHCHLRFAGGVSIIPNQHLPQIGDTSTEMKITHLNWSGNVLHIDADFSSFAKTAFQLKTPLKVTNVKGAAIRSLSDGLYELTVQPAQGNRDYKPSEVAVTFANP